MQIITAFDQHERLKSKFSRAISFGAEKSEAI